MERQKDRLLQSSAPLVWLHSSACSTHTAGRCCDTVFKAVLCGFVLSWRMFVGHQLQQCSALLDVKVEAVMRQVQQAPPILCSPPQERGAAMLRHSPAVMYYHSQQQQEKHSEGKVPQPTCLIQHAPSQPPTTEGSARASAYMNWFMPSLLNLLKCSDTHRSVAPLLATRGTTTHPGVDLQPAAAHTHAEAHNNGTVRHKLWR